MSNFRKGQRLVCSGDRFSWFSGATGLSGCGPGFDEVVTCVGYDQYGVLLKEYDFGEGYNPAYFRPLIEDLTAELARKAEDSLVHERPERVNEPQEA